MSAPPPGIVPPGGSLTLNPTGMKVDIDTLEDGSLQYWVCFLTGTRQAPMMEYRFGPYSQERWDAWLAILHDPVAAAEAANARAKIIVPPNGQAMQ